MQQELRVQKSSGSSGRGRTAREYARAAPLNGASRAPGDAAPAAAVAAAAAARLGSRWARSPSECARPCAGRGTGKDAPGGAAGPGFPRDALSERCSLAKAESPRGRCPLALLTPLSALRPAGGVPRCVPGRGRTWFYLYCFLSGSLAAQGVPRLSAISRVCNGSPKSRGGGAGRPPLPQLETEQGDGRVELQREGA